MYVIIAKDCDDCGGEVRVRLVTERPSDEAVDKVAGAGRCVRTWVIAAEPNGQAVAKGLDDE